jgi:hypothetical protein
MKVMRPCPRCGIEYLQHKHGRAKHCDECGPIVKREVLAKFRRTPRGKYTDQRQAAKQRGIPWKFTFESWLEWWGEDLSRRGTRRDDLCMARIGDVGPYSPENCVKLTNYENQNLKLPKVSGRPRSTGVPREQLHRS